MKLKIKRSSLVRKVDGVKKSGYYGRVVTNGKKSLVEILKESCHGSTVDYREAKLGLELMLDSVAERVKEGYIIDMGPLGTLYPAVNGKWEQDADDLLLADMTPKVNYRPSDDIAGAIRAASLQWATEKEAAENDSNGTTTDDPDPTTDPTTDPTPSGDLEA